jgi:hypothetical protein
MTAEPTIDYEGLAQEAMRGVVRTVLVRTAKSGLTGDHHFYISFDTESPGVTLSKRLKEKYPREMTIVLQHRFWDLIVTDERFEVKLTFDGIPERLVVPFSAIKVFFDPSVRFGLQFEDPNAAPEARTSPSQAFDNMTARNGGTQRPSGSSRKVPRAPRKARPAQEADGTQQASAETGANSPSPTSEPTPISAAKPAAPVVTFGGDAVGVDDGKRSAAAEADADPAKPSGGAEIVSLDKFRKK